MKYQILIQIIILLVSSFFAYINIITWVDSLILSILSFVFVELISHKLEYSYSSSKIKSDIFLVNNSLQNIDQRVQLNLLQLNLKEKMSNLKHPYFVSIMQYKLENFINESENIFNNEHITKPVNYDTYGATGLKFTKKKLEMCKLH